jgi:hypothetical protein
VPVLVLFQVKDSYLMEVARATFSRLEHLQNSRDPNKQGRIVNSLRRAVEKLKSSSKQLRGAFLEKYEINVKAGKVQFTIPKNGSVMDLLTEAQMISFIGRGAVAVYPTCQVGTNL